MSGLIICSRTPKDKTDYPASSTLDGNPFIVNDFVISTSTANVAHFSTNGSSLQVYYLTLCNIEFMN